MNIFVLDQDILLAARYHCDRHVVKMITETAQLLSSAYHAAGQAELAPYKAAYLNHPCALWTRESDGNWLWLADFGAALYQEYRYRFGDKNHAAGEKILAMRLHPPILPGGPRTPQVQCMPDQYRREDTVEAYRAYYTGEKSHLFKWTGRPRPPWIKERTEGQSEKMDSTPPIHTKGDKNAPEI